VGLRHGWLLCAARAAAALVDSGGRSIAQPRRRRQTDEAATVSVLVGPVGVLFNAFVAPLTMPGWSGTLAARNPLSATVGACRRSFGNPGWGVDSWIAAHALPMAVAWPLLLTGVFLPLSVRAYRRPGG
jgi:ABC-2 type transport system permease protein